MHILRYHFIVENSSNVFQIRPFKEFIASKGRDRLLSLSRLSHLIVDDSILPPSSDVDASSSSRPTNAYDFMQLRRRVTGDPTAQRWNASVRLTNFASVDSSPLCVSPNSLVFRPAVSMRSHSAAGLYRSPTRSHGQRTSTD